MKIKVQREAMLKALQRVGNIIGSRTTLPVLANVCMEACNGQLVLTATDLELRITTTVEAEIEAEGKTTLPAKKLIGLVSKFRGSTIEFESNENFHTTIKCGTANIMLLGLNPDDFPTPAAFEAKNTFSIKQAEIASLIDSISYAVSIDDSRKVLQGILFSIHEGKLTAVATDGKRLALTEKILDNAPADINTDIIVTLKAANEIKRLVDKEGDVKVEIGDNQITFTIGNTVILSKLIEGTYPNYRQVIPKFDAEKGSKEIKIACESFIYALDILSVTLSDSAAPNVKLIFKDNKLVFEANSNIGEGSESIDIDYTGDEMAASFNPNFLLDPFKHIPVDNMTLKMNDVVSPIAIESGTGFLYVIMPMRSK